MMPNCRPNSPLVKAAAAAVDDADTVRAELWEQALRDAHGNSAEAARDFLGANRQRGHYLTKRHGLQSLARQLKQGRRASAD